MVKNLLVSFLVLLLLFLFAMLHYCIIVLSLLGSGLSFFSGFWSPSLAYPGFTFLFVGLSTRASACHVLGSFTVAWVDRPYFVSTACCVFSVVVFSLASFVILDFSGSAIQLGTGLLDSLTVQLFVCLFVYFVCVCVLLYNSFMCPHFV